MGHLLHSNAKTTTRIKKEIQESKDSIESLKKKYNINHKTVLYWKHNDSIYDKKNNHKNPRSTVLTKQEEQIICEFRRVTKFSLDDVYICLIDLIPKMTRSNPHRCLQRYGLSRLPKQESNLTKKSLNTMISAMFKLIYLNYIQSKVKAICLLL